MASPLAERSDIILSDLQTHLQELDLTKVVLVVATECKTSLPCCSQTLGPRNSQVSKLWAAVHWKDTSCAAYWKDKHVLCIRKYRKNSAYAKEEEVLTLLQDQYPDIASRFLHKLAKNTDSPNTRTRQPLGARLASSVTLNSNSATRFSAAVKTPESVKVVVEGKSTSKEEVSPTQGRIVGVRPPLKARLSEPVLHSNSSRPPARPSMVTRRQSSIAISKPASTASVDLKARVRPSASPSTTASTSPPIVALQVKRRVSAVEAATAKPVSLAGRRIASASASYIPTPTKRPLIAAARRVSAATPETPTARKSLEVQLAMSPLVPVQAKACKDIATQTEAEDTIVEASRYFQTELASLTLRIQELELENVRLSKRVEIDDTEQSAHEADKGRLEGELAAKDAIIKDLLEQLRAARPVTRTSQEGRSSVSTDRRLTRMAEVAAEHIPSAHKLQTMLYATPPRVRFQLDMLPVPSTPDCSETYSTPMSIRSTPSHCSPARKIQSPLAVSLKKGKGGFRLFRFLTKRRMSGR